MYGPIYLEPPPLGIGYSLLMLGGVYAFYYGILKIGCWLIPAIFERLFKD